MNFVVSLSQVYVLEVRWSEGTTTVVFRRYSDFFEFQVCYVMYLPIPSFSVLHT